MANVSEEECRLLQTSEKRSDLDLVLSQSSTSLPNDGLTRPSFCTKWFPSGYWPECKGLFGLAWPIILTEFSQYAIGMVATIFCGHLGKIELDAVALANTMINVTGISIAIGLATACDTYFAQIYGSPNKQDLGVYLQKSLLLLPLGLFPCWAIHLNAESLMRALGQDPDVSRLGGEYLLWFMPGLFFFFIYIPLSKYIQCQNIVLPNVLIGLLANGVSALAHYVTIYPLEMGTVGSAISQVLGYLSLLVFTIVYILWSKCYVGTWQGWSAECLEEWWDFFKLGFFGLGMIGVEWWSFEIGTFLAGVLGTTELGAQVILFQLQSFTYVIPLGLGIASSIRVGQYLGNGDTASAKTSSRVALTMILASGTVVMILIAALKDYLPRVFTDVKEVTDLAAQLLPILAVFMIFDSCNGVCAGILRGSGRQKIGSIIICITYAVALAAAVPLMFLTSLRVAGFWIALAGALVVEFVLFSIIIARANWETQAENARIRTGEIPYIKVEEDERTSLLGSSKEGSQPRLNVYGTSPAESDVTREQSRTPLKKLMLEKLAVLGIVVLIFIAGLLVRIFVKIPFGPSSNPGNSTAIPEYITTVPSVNLFS